MAQTIAERYTLGDIIGEGAMGTVYRGMLVTTGETVAIKQMKDAIATPELIERFQREAAALRDLNHPNIIALRELVEQDDHHYLIMDFVSGGDLYTLLKRDTLSPTQVVTMGIDLADALTRAHKLNIVHRDIKPANVLIDTDGTLKLTDFGVAQVKNKHTITDEGAIVGTIDYIAPEAFSGVDSDPRSDIWAFGVLLYEMLLGERPFSGNTLMHTISAITQQPTPDILEKRPDTPIALADLIYRMLEKDPQARVPSVRYVGALLEDIKQERPTSTQLPATSRFNSANADTNQAVRMLPVQATPFIGRDTELQELQSLLADDAVRLITIIAPGGMGKTRLSLEVAEQRLSDFKDGAVFIELAPVNDADNIAGALADALGFKLNPASDAQEQIAGFLSAQEKLLIFDNFEHVLDGVRIVTACLNAAPNVKVIATSRKALQQAGETLFHLGGMDFPDWETPEDALEYAAVKLFMSSARRAQPSFELEAEHLPYVARICRMVAGMPLGIVLAASWLAMLSLEEIASEIQEGIDFLEADGGEIPERQRSIRAVCDYAWATLSDKEQHIFTYLSIFIGGFTREAAQAVSGASLRNLMSLVKKSLITRNAISGRYGIHELLRQYAYEKLEASGELDPARKAHATYYADLLRAIAPKMKGHGQLSAFKTIAADVDNIHEAFDYGFDATDADILDGLFESYAIYGETTQDAIKLGAPILRGYRTLDGRVSDVLYAKFITEAASMRANPRNDEDYFAPLERACAIFEAHDEPEWQCKTLFVRAEKERNFGRLDDAIETFKTCRVLAQDIGYGWAERMCESSLGVIANQFQLNPEVAQAHFERAQTIAENIGDTNGLRYAQFYLGVLMQERGQYEDALAYLEEAGSDALEFDHYRRYGRCAFLKADALFSLDRPDDALATLQQARKTLANLNQRETLYWTDHDIFRMYLFRGDYEDILTKTKPFVESLPNIPTAQTFWRIQRMTEVGYAHAAFLQGDVETAREIFVPYFLELAPISSPHPLSVYVLGLAALKAHDGDPHYALEIMRCTNDSLPVFNTLKTQFMQDHLAKIRAQINDDALYDKHWEKGTELDYMAIIAEFEAELSATEA